MLHQEQKSYSVFFVAVVLHEDPKSPSAERVAGYKPFGLVSSSVIKVQRKTHSQIRVRMHYVRHEEFRPIKDSSCSKNDILFHCLSYTCCEDCNTGSVLQQFYVNFYKSLVVTQRQAVTEQLWADTSICVVRRTVDTQHRVTQRQQSNYCNNHATCFRNCSHWCGKMSKKTCKEGK